ncbi:hypothetical protein EVAR_40996_1 [Eumeta japonica]|uniref:Uncharacterized protein n=1 Tax=Eumeta variegata TaxID=151549 RepID=A0A4C1XEY2_EUMVA|nr:hypothetical protein EVAR_40996_1 [Eumeta japonica]
MFMKNFLSVYTKSPDAVAYGILHRRGDNRPSLEAETLDRPASVYFSRHAPGNSRSALMHRDVIRFETASGAGFRFGVTRRASGGLAGHPLTQLRAYIYLDGIGKFISQD